MISFLKKLQTEYGQQFQCVDFYEQPSFRLPYVKNHTYQVQPSMPSPPSKSAVNKSRSPSAKADSINCPNGTVPVLTSYNSSSGIRYFGQIRAFGGYQSGNSGGGNLAAFATRLSSYYGAQATISVWEPDLGPGDAPRSSGSVLTMHNGENTKLSGLYVGLFVDPYLYGDDRVHLEVGWLPFDEQSNYGAACVNLLCPGFVQLSSNVVAGNIVEPPSMVDGNDMVIQVRVYKAQDENWYLLFGEDEELVGYWPNQLLPHMYEAASIVSWGGITNAAPGEPFPPMGSGRSPEEGRGKAAYFINAMVAHMSNQLLAPDLTMIFMAETYPECKQLGQPDTDGGLEFYYGGAGCSPS
ncbi:hypothetical protein GUJ93_ZPchr0011g27423 [Zizania palustris]|uniref:Neprosin PEP catalytic domain-containing protein n=1 Tax=Zizania palustris TaxID=103762 RepID=A0A8J5WJH2_ZIZPA|nr:hypothetical protein GUJ93_ZPchr0011g27423 [Zizania palustris]